MPRPDHEAALRAQPRPIRAARAPDAAGRQLDRQHRARARRAARHAQLAATSCAPASGSTAAGPGRICDQDGRPAVLQVRARPAALLEVPPRGAVRAVADRLPRPPDPAREGRARRSATACATCAAPARAGVSPRRLVYPACSTNSGQRRVTLGTSVGWSDIYPPTYPEQWLDVTGFRGCFALPPHGGPTERRSTRARSATTRHPVARAAALQAGDPALSGSPLACAGPHARSAGHALPLLRLRPACPPPAYP